MKCPSPEILDLFYRSCAFPIDDLDIQEVVQHTSSVFASTWYVPTKSLPAIFFVIGGGNGCGDLSALIYEIRRLAQMSGYTAAALNWPVEKRTAIRGLCFHYVVQVNHLNATVYRKSVEPWDDALMPLLHTAVLHPWFKPDAYANIYDKGLLDINNLPSATISDEDMEFLGDPDEPVAKRIKPKKPQFEDAEDAENNEDDFLDDDSNHERLSSIKLSQEDMDMLGLSNVTDDV